MLFGEKNLLGVDIGAFSIKAVLLKGSRGSYTLKAAACVKLPEENGMALPATPEFLKDALRSNKISASTAAALLTSSSLVFRHMSLPAMPEKDLKEAVSWEMRKESGIPANDIVADYVHADGKKEENKVSLFAFAARKGDAEKTISFFSEAGLELRVLEAKPTALLKAFDLNGEWENNANYAMLDIGEAKSTLAILKNRKLVFARDITIGGKDLTHALGSALGKTDEEAEEYKTANGLIVPEGDDGRAKRYLAISVESLCSELQRSFDYYQAQFREGTVTKLFLSGGTARLRGIDSFMGGLIGVSCFIDDPFRKMKAAASIDSRELAQIAPCMTMAAGLASEAAR